MRCPICRREIPDREVARHLASKGGKRMTPKKTEAILANLEKAEPANSRRRNVHLIPKRFGIVGCSKRFATPEEALAWSREHRRLPGEGTGPK